MIKKNHSPRHSYALQKKSRCLMAGAIASSGTWRRLNFEQRAPRVLLLRAVKRVGPATEQHQFFNAVFLGNGSIDLLLLFGTGKLNSKS
jgi:hypothetical protein